MGLSQIQRIVITYTWPSQKSRTRLWTQNGGNNSRFWHVPWRGLGFQILLAFWNPNWIHFGDRFSFQMDLLIWSSGLKFIRYSGNFHLYFNIFFWPLLRLCSYHSACWSVITSDFMLQFWNLLGFAWDVTKWSQLLGIFCNFSSFSHRCLFMDHSYSGLRLHEGLFFELLSR